MTQALSIIFHERGVDMENLSDLACLQLVYPRASIL